MAKELTKKQRGFVNDYAETGNGVQSALKNYDTDDYTTASVIATENLEKPRIIEELKKLGFDSNNAKRVVSEILNDDSSEDKDRLKAAEQVFKVMGDYAPEKSLNVNLNVDADETVKALTEKLNAIHGSPSIPSDGQVASVVGLEAQDKE